MTNEEYRRAIDDVIYLSGCAVNGVIPDKERIEKTDPALLYEAAERHMLTALTAYALESAGITDNAFRQAKAKSIRKVTVMEIERERLIEHLEQEGIWYMSLKGSVIKNLYPSVGLRQMSDNDILFDKEYAEKVREIMLDMGFTCEHFGLDTHDVYHKKPVSNFEMHTSLFSETFNKEIYDHYRNIKDRLIKDEGNSFGYHFSSSDLYIYLTAHEYKHYTISGTGLRSLLDTYMIWKKLGDELDEEYITEECRKLGIADFEQKSRQLALKLFGGGELTDEEREMLEYIVYSGTYGTVRNTIENSVKEKGGGRKGKLRFLRDKLFLPMDVIKAVYPFYYRHKILLPGLFFYRLFKAATIKRKETANTLRILRKTNK